MATTTEEDRATTAANKGIAKGIANKGLAWKGLYIVRSAGRSPTGSPTAEVVSDMWRSWCKQIDAGYKKVRRGGDFGRARRRGRKYDIDYLFFFRC